MAFSLKFWKKESVADGKTGKIKQSGPKDLSQKIGMHLVVKEKQDPDWVWGLKMVTKSRDENKNVSDFRIFSPASAGENGIGVLNYDSLMHHPELVLYEGWHDKKSGEMVCNKR